MTDLDAATPTAADLSLEQARPGRGPLSRSWPWPMRRMVETLFRHIDVGRVTIVSPDGDAISSKPVRPGPDAVLVLHRWRALRRLVVGGDVAFGEAYTEGDWSSPDVAALVELAALNDEAFRETITGSRIARLFNRMRLLLRPNTRRGSSRNIVAHYDLGNDFYAGWLDGSMLYSSGLYPECDSTLEEAQERKLDRLVDALQLSGGERVLEIGCGWGGLVERLGRLGCHVTGVTISPSQLAFARARIEAAGLSDRVELRLQDYRDIRGTFDRIVSVEMIEAVGQRYWPTYFGALHDRLAPGGLAVLQAITIADERFDLYASAPDFIQLYVFPGGMLPSPSILEAQSRLAGLSVETVERFGQSYAQTLRDWRQRFAEAPLKRKGPGDDERFRRLWTYYLAYCEGGFRSGATDVGIYRLTPCSR